MSPARQPLDLRLGTFFLWLLVLAPPLVFAPVAKESFRQPKLLAAEWLALASLACLAWGLARVGRVGLADLWRPAAVRIVLPLLVVATLGLAFTSHPFHVREANAILNAEPHSGWLEVGRGQAVRRHSGTSRHHSEEQDGQRKAHYHARLQHGLHQVP